MGKQLYRLIDVLKVQDVTAERRVEHELALIKVRATNANRAEIVTHRRALQGPRHRRGRRLGHRRATRHRGGDRPLWSSWSTAFGIKEMVRTGSVVMLRGAQTVEFEEKA